MLTDGCRTCWIDDYLGLLGDDSGASGAQGERAGVDKGLMEVSRALYGLFPSYTDSPLPVRFDRIIPVRHASGQLPLPHAGIRCMVT